MGEICYNGSHGTSSKQCEEILKSGFHISTGRGGYGVYFWVESPLYLKLAKDWFICKSKKGAYKEENPKCAIIIATLKTTPTEYLDLEDYTLKGQLYDLGVKHGLNLASTHEVAKLHNLFIKTVERKLGTSIKMLTVRVAPPDKESYPIKAIGAPLCCIVRTLDVITIKECVSCDGV